MDSARTRVTAAVAGKADSRRRVETDAEGAFVVEEQGLAAVLAGDVVELAGAIAAPDPVASALAKGAAAVAPDRIVFQRADQLRHLLALPVADADDTDLDPADPAGE
jgi:hypothetical protein